MPKFKQHKSQDIWYSSHSTPYTRPGSYKMCIRVDANGCGDDAAGTHVSVYAYLMKGRNDENLPWPFTGEVTITLLNQLADKTFNLIPMRQWGNQEGSGWGEGLHRIYTQLDAQWNRQHLKDDCLYFSNPVKPWHVLLLHGITTDQTRVHTEVHETSILNHKCQNDDLEGTAGKSF